MYSFCSARRYPPQTPANSKTSLLAPLGSRFHDPCDKLLVILSAYYLLSEILTSAETDMLVKKYRGPFAQDAAGP